MKGKIILLCVIFLIAKSLFAQSPLQYGVWINEKEYGSFPPKVLKHKSKAGVSFPVSNTLQNKMQQLLNVFKEAHPKPVFENIWNTSFNEGFKTKNNLLAFNMRFVCERFNAPVDRFGYCVVNVNSAPTDGGALMLLTDGSFIPPFSKLQDLEKILVQNDFYGIKELTLMAPLLQTKKVFKSPWINNNTAPIPPALNNLPQNAFHYRTINKDFRDEEDVIAEMVVLTSDGALPYKPLSIKQVLELVKLKIDFDKAETLKFLDYTVSNKDNNTPKQQEKIKTSINTQLAAHDAEYTILEKLKNYNKAKLNNIAVINPAHQDFAYQNLFLYTADATDPLKIEDVFISESNLGRVQLGDKNCSIRQ
jgi:hypothetical protein